ncbi:MAG: ABC transporter ATP-binding protein [Rhodospirillum sp.]|nr:ABC transporter ATP-binding protein [Rhodospirillum sp.]MCF8490162.1 ABC transporter ATP-binding protein [Rhodospirillum sp.]
MIRVEVESKVQGSKEILRDVRFQVDQGEVLAILGPSGIGKSTLLRICAGIDRRFQGRVERPERLAMVFQEPVLLPWRSAVDNLTLTVKGLTREAALAALARVGLADRAEAYPRQLSLGQQRRVALARAFRAQPDVLLLDEPFASLDRASAEDMIALTEALIAETRPAILFVTHSEAEAARLATRIIRLSGQPATLDSTSVPPVPPGAPPSPTAMETAP